MRHLGIREEDIEESFIRSSGPGGQNVNKVATCVMLLHRPTGISVKCQKTRSQGLNRYHARCLLIATFEHRQKEALQKQIAEREKQRRKNRQRPRQLKVRILEHKRRHAEKKMTRQKIQFYKVNSD